MRNVNIEGIEADPSITGVLRALKNFKQGALLENSLFTSSYRTSPELGQIAPEIEIAKLVKQEITQHLAKELVDRHHKSIEVTEITEFPGVKNHKLELIVMRPDELKHVVEYCIRQIPEEALSRIRSTK